MKVSFCWALNTIVRTSLYQYIYILISTCYFFTQPHISTESKSSPRHAQYLYCFKKTRTTENLQYYYCLSMEGETIHKTTIL